MKTPTKAVLLIAATALASAGLTSCAPEHAWNLLGMMWQDAATGQSTNGAPSGTDVFKIPADKAGTMTFQTDLHGDISATCDLLWEGSHRLSRGPAKDGKATFVHTVQAPGLKHGSSLAGMNCTDLDGVHYSASFTIKVVAEKPTHVYWAAIGSGAGVGRVGVNGDDPQSSFIETPRDGARSVVVDSEYIYWAGDGDGGIGRADLDGRSPRPNFIQVKAESVAIGARHIYWTNGASIGRAELDGSDVDPSFIELDTKKLVVLTGLAADGDHLYWSTAFAANAGAIGRSGLNGERIRTKFIELSRPPTGMAVNSRHLYWAYGTRGKAERSIGRATLDGTDAQSSFMTASGFVAEIAADDRHLYWTDAMDDHPIMQAHLDGSDPMELASPRGYLEGLASGPGEDVPVPRVPVIKVRPEEVAFGDQPVNTVAERTVTVSNAGLGPLTFRQSGILDGPDSDQYDIRANTCSAGAVPPAGSCAVTVRFTPTVTGSLRANLRFTGNWPESFLMVDLTGRGTTPAGFAAAPSPLAFGDTQVLIGRTADITVTNTGSGTLTFGPSAVTVSQNPSEYFVDTDQCSSRTVAPGATCTVRMYYRPGAEGPGAGVVQFTDNAAGSPQSVSMTGTGTPFVGFAGPDR